MAANQSIQNESTFDDTMSIQPNKIETDQTLSTAKAVVILIVIFIFSLLIMVYLYYSFPELSEEEKNYIKIPFNIKDAQNLGKVLEHYKDNYYTQVFMCIFFCYIFLQTFAIPGSISLSILCGFLYPFILALGIICFCSALGASFCYLLSMTIGRRLAYKYFPERIKSYALLVKKHNHNMLSYIMFLRITPFLPNWFINVCAPLVDVPLIPFWAGTFFGVAVPSVLAVQAGQTLHELTSTSSTWSWTSVLLLATFATLSLLPVLFKAKLRDKFD
ncbi:transmembrane protein 41B-like isoform X1 [Daktulosphaira vitifoliae]|uniref:transmembrane protein 41B-like isoform X1 n=1 Tax=Daktulosphaira vitifoliae TaxID=58002 RepID=UPI0021A9B7D2|nr:transmembrane protein 41B-like isoform X1 [Daktulosphaira vitifoliae]